MKNNGQITIFFVMGIILIITAILLYSSNTEPELEPIEKDSNFEQTAQSFQTFTENCLEQLAEKALIYYDQQTREAKKEGLKPRFEVEQFVRLYLNLQATSCFDESLFPGVNIRTTPPYFVTTEETVTDIKITIKLPTELLQDDSKKTIEAYEFEIPKEAKDLPPITGLIVGDSVFTVEIPFVSENATIYKEGEAIVSYNTQPRNSAAFSEAISKLPVQRERFYHALLTAYPIVEDDGEFKDLLYDELVIFDNSKITFDELKQTLESFSVVRGVYRNENVFTENSLFELQQEAFGTSEAFNDNLYRYQWYLENTGQFAGTPGADINIKDIPELKPNDVTIAVIDQGIFRNPDLSGVVTAKNFDVAKNVRDVTPGSDSEKHGTHVMGVIAAEPNNDIGIAGICPQCEVFNLKMFSEKSSSSTKDLANAIVLAAAQGADIISMSLTHSLYSEYEQFIISQLDETILVAAAGNDGLSEHQYPAAYENVIAVGATDNKDRKAFFSNFGDWVDIYAPGTQILSTCTENEFCFMPGTSMATPIVSGVIGLILTQNKTLTPNEVKDVLIETADQTPDGLKRINAKNALEALRN